MDSTVIIQRNILNYRKGFFDLLSYKRKYKLIASTKNIGKFIASKSNSDYRYPIINFKVGEYIIFPFLIFTLIKLKPSIIITEGGQNTINNLFVLIYSKISNCEYIIWDLGKGYEKEQKKVSFLRKIYTKIYNLILKHSIKVFTYNDKSVEYFKSIGYIQKPIIPLKNTIDTREVIKSLENFDQKLQNRLNKKFSRHKYHILFVGAINEHKNLESFKEFKELLGEDYAFVIIGKGREEYMMKIKQYLGTKNVYFEGYKNMDELKYYYNMADFLLLPGLGGLAINQAMAFGLPIVCTHADGIEDELVITDKTGYKYEIIEDAVEYILSKEKNEWKAMGDNAKELIFKTYTIEKMVDRFIAGIENE